MSESGWRAIWRATVADPSKETRSVPPYFPALKIRRRALAIGVAFGVWLAVSPAGGAGEPLRIRVTPAIAQPPAFVTIRADVEAHDDNRALEITAEAENFFTSSRVPLEGAKGPRFSEVHFDNLPEGRYAVKVVLVGTLGTRATATRFVLVGTPPTDDPL